MKITVYTINDCQFSKQEKEYLTSHKLTFDEKNLETNKEFLTEMLAVSNNFAGTPVTKIDKDDGQIIVLKGFTKEEFDKALGFAAPEEKKLEPKPPVESTTPTMPMPPAPPAVQPTTPMNPTPPVTTPPQTPPTTPAVDTQLDAILNDLQAKAAPPPQVVPPSPVSPPPAPGGLPTIPEPDFKTS
ncbi:MAG: glutaredoxin family protein [bacterium]|nr:glutaredoxin family protein [bacterium]